MKMDNRRLNREQKTVRVMIRMYCRFHHKSGNELCPDCLVLQQYAEKRIQKCPYGINKPTCANCTTHCYKPAMRQKIREVMSFAGPRMIFRHPYLAVMHVVDGWRERRAHKRSE